MKVYLLYEVEFGDEFVVAAYRDKNDAERDKHGREREVCGPNNDIVYHISTVELI